jgi:asparaginyl-tRNA synthetase
MITRIASLLKNPAGTESNVIGWVRTVRSQKKYSFVEVDDGSGSIQVVIPSEKIHNLVTGSSVQVKGTVVQGPNAREIQGEHIQVIGNSDVVGLK